VGRGGAGAGVSTVPLKGKPSATERDGAGGRRLRARGGRATRRRRGMALLPEASLRRARARPSGSRPVRAGARPRP